MAGVIQFEEVPIKTRPFVSRLAVLGLLALSVGACDTLGPDEPKGPGSLLATLVSPLGNEGSAVFELTGGVGLGTVSALGGEVFSQHFGGSTRVVVIMHDPGEIRFRVRSEDVGHLPGVTVIQVADGEDQLRTSLSGYTVRFAREEDPSGGGQP